MCGSTVGSGGGQELAVTYDLACFGRAFCCRESAYGAVDRLLDGTVCPVCIGVAAWGLFRSRFDCCQPFGGEREKHFCCSYYDYGDDDCQFVRCPGREFPGALSVLAFGFCDCSVVGRYNDLVYPEVGSCFARPAGDESERAVSFFEKAGTVLLAGASMCVGNYLGGHLSDRFTPGIVAMSMQFLMFASLLLIYFFASYGFLSALLMCVCTGCLFAVSSPQQLLLLQYSPGGEMMGGAMVQLAFNLGNAVGAYFGGLSIEHGAGLESTALIGSFFALLGTTVFLVFNYMVLKPQWKLL